jgi:hypothetical protein
MGKLKTGLGNNISDDETTGRLGAFAYPEHRAARAVAEHQSIASNAQAVTSTPKSEDFLPRSAASISGEVRQVYEPFIAPNGSMFCSPEIKKGILPLMLQEILETRQMVSFNIVAAMLFIVIVIVL